MLLLNGAYLPSKLDTVIGYIASLKLSSLSSPPIPFNLYDTIYIIRTYDYLKLFYDVQYSFTLISLLST